MRLGDDAAKVRVSVISTGALSLDLALGARLGQRCRRLGRFAVLRRRASAGGLARVRRLHFARPI